MGAALAMASAAASDTQWSGPGGAPHDVKQLKPASKAKVKKGRKTGVR